MSRNVAGMSDAQSDVWLQFIAISDLLPAALDAQLQRDSQLTHFEFGVLSVLRLSDRGHLSPTEIAKARSATLPRLSHVLSKLEQRDLISRSPTESDGRGVDVRLTDAGRRAVIRATPGHIATAKALVLDGFSDTELETLGGLLRRITTRLDPQDRLGKVIRAGE